MPNEPDSVAIECAPYEDLNAAKVANQPLFRKTTMRLTTVNRLGIPLVLGDNSDACGSRTLRFAQVFVGALLGVVPTILDRPTHIPQSAWEELEALAALSIVAAYEAGRAVFLTKTYIRWYFTGVWRRRRYDDCALGRSGTVLVPDAPSANPSGGSELPMWLTLVAPGLLSLAHRSWTLLFLHQVRAKRWGAKGRFCALYLGPHAAPGNMNQPIILAAPSSSEELLRAYVALVLDGATPIEPMEKLIWRLHELLSAEESESAVTKPPGADAPEVPVRARHSWAAKRMIKALVGSKREFAEAVRVPTIKYANLRTTLQSLASTLNDGGARSLRKTLAELLVAAVVDQTLERTLPTAALLAWLKRQPADFQHERPMERVLAEILALPLFVPAQASRAYGWKDTKNAQVGTLWKEREWLRNAIVASFPIGSLDRDLALALISRRIGKRPLGSLAELRDTRYIQSRLSESMRCPAPDHRQMRAAIHARLVEWQESLVEMKSGDERADLSIAWELPESILAHPEVLQPAVVLLEESRAAEELSHSWPVPGAPLAEALNAARFSVALDVLVARARSLHAVRREG